MNNCRQCKKDWDDCPCPSWSVNNFFFARPQMFKLCQDNLEWQQGVEGFTENKKKRGHASPFERVSCIIAEVEKRLSFCGEFGKQMVFEAQKSQRIEDMTPESKEVLNYISGNWRRKVCYFYWRLHLENEKKPCECGHNKWKTVRKHHSWKCRKCGKVRNSESLNKVLELV